MGADKECGCGGSEPSAVAESEMELSAGSSGLPRSEPFGLSLSLMALYPETASRLVAF